MTTPSFQIDTLVGALTEAWKTSGMSKRALASKAGLHENSLRLFGSGQWQPRIETIRRLEEALLQQPG